MHFKNKINKIQMKMSSFNLNRSVNCYKTEKVINTYEIIKYINL